MLMILWLLINISKFSMYIIKLLDLMLKLTKVGTQSYIGYLEDYLDKAYYVDRHVCRSD